jgi:hypothetical protein
VSASSGLYAGEHQAIRRALEPYVPGSRCWRCGRPILEGQPWDLGHDDDDPTLYRGPEHARCSRQAGARKGNARRRARRERMIRMVAEICLGVEISEDRQHTSLVAAGRIDGGDLVLVDLLKYLDGPDPVAAVLQVREERSVLHVVVDPHSNAATVIQPLEAAKVTVLKPSSSDVVVAHGTFLDALAAGRVRHAGQPELTAAARHLEQRRLGGSTAPERRGAPVDVGPAVACELAVWALLVAPPPAQPFAFFGTWR